MGNSEPFTDVIDYFLLYVDLVMCITITHFVSFSKALFQNGINIFICICWKIGRLATAMAQANRNPIVINSKVSKICKL